MNPSFSGATTTLMLSTSVNQSVVSSLVIALGSDNERGDSAAVVVPALDAGAVAAGVIDVGPDDATPAAG
jgi:hypothetical protein